MTQLCVHGRVDDLDLDARSQWVGQRYVGHFFYVTLTLKTFIWLDYLVVVWFNTD